MAKEIISKMKRPPIKWEKIFANNISNKELISKIYKEFIQLNSKKLQIIRFLNGGRVCFRVGGEAKAC